MRGRLVLGKDKRRKNKKVIIFFMKGWNSFDPSFMNAIKS